jgi:hypothetical protein
MLVLLAIIGDEKKAGYKTVRGRATVDAETGANFFKEAPGGTHCYVVKAMDDSFYRDMIDEILDMPC